MKCSYGGMSTASGGGDCRQLLKGTSWERRFIFAKMVIRQRRGKKNKVPLTECRILARTNVTAVLAALAGGGCWHPHPTPMSGKTLVQN